MKFRVIYGVIAVLLFSLLTAAGEFEPFRDTRSGRVIFIRTHKSAADPSQSAIGRAVPAISSDPMSTLPRTYYRADNWHTYDPVGWALSPRGSSTRNEKPGTRNQFLPPPDGFIPNTLTISDTFIEAHGRVFGLKDPINELIPYTVKNDGKGMLHINYYQQYQGVPVFGSEIIVHVGSDKEVRSANGRAVTDVNIDATPSLSEEEAITAAKGFYRKQFTTPEPQVMKTKLWVFNPGLVENKEDPTTYLVYEVELDSLKPKVNELFFVDAKTGELVFQLAGIRKDNPYPVDRRVYDCSYRIYLSLAGCGLDDYEYLLPYTFGCSEGNCPRGALPSSLGTPYSGTNDTDKLYDILGYTHDYLWLKFQRSGGNGRGGIGDGQNHSMGVAHFTLTTGWTYLDALGASCYPVASFNNYSVTTCLGAVITDLVAHEYGHSLTYFHSFNPDDTWNSITYYGESGALTENYSDVLAEGVENYVHGSNDWIFVNDPSVGGPYRNLADPPSITYDPYDGPPTPAPERYNDPNFYCGLDDFEGLHWNGNVLNKGAYLTAMGGSFNGCDITGLGLPKMEQIWYHAMEYYYTVNSNFNDAYYALNQACSDLEQTGVVAPGECRQVEKALQAIEIDQAGFCSGIPGTPPACAYDPNCMAANLDGNLPIDLTDLAILTAGWLQTEPGDIDQSGQVNLADYQHLANYWLSDCLNHESQPTAWAKSPPYNVPLLEEGALNTPTSPDKADTLEVFVMSLCPYAKQTETTLLNFLDALESNNRPRLVIRYLFERRRTDDGITYTSLHGQPEILENLVQMILRDSFNPELLFAYLRLRAESEKPWDKLTGQIGLTAADNQFIRDCITTNRDELIADEYNSMLTTYGRLTRSPTFTWQGKPIRSLSDLPFDFALR